MTLLFLLLLNVFPASDCQGMDEIRAYYGNITTEEQLLSFMDLLESSSCNVKEAYMSSAVMQKAQFAFAPWTKYRYFLKGKKMLEDYILSKPDDVDARYIRFMVQNHVPSFLGYKMNIKEDAQVILDHIELAEISDSYKAQIKFHLNKFLKD